MYRRRLFMFLYITPKGVILCCLEENNIHLSSCNNSHPARYTVTIYSHFPISFPKGTRRLLTVHAVR